MKALGKHIIAEFYECDRTFINDEKHIEELFLDTARDSGATVVTWSFHKFSPHGVSGMVVVAESHFSIHTWPEYGYCSVDIFTCGDLINNQLALKLLQEGLGSKNTSVVELNRGIVGVSVGERPSSPCVSERDIEGVAS